MQVSVNGVRLFFDVEGAKLVPDGPVMRENPVLLMLHGGPGADHLDRRIELFERFGGPEVGALARAALSGDTGPRPCLARRLGATRHPALFPKVPRPALPPHLVQFERFADCGHACMPDAPERTVAAIRKFIAK
jgi:pimeloyl-ACP methyl ester carboxylesterase